MLASAIWATSFIGIRYLVTSLPPLTVAGLRYTLAFVLFLPLLLSRRRPLPGKGQWGRLAAVGLVQYTLGNGALFLALRWVSSTAGALTQGLAPLLTLLLEWGWARERFSLPALVGVLLAVGGAVGFFGPGSVGISSGPALPLLGLTTLAFALFPLLVRAAGVKDTVALTAWPLGFGGGALLLISLALNGIPRLSLFQWGIVAGLALVNTVLAYLLFTHALSRLRATEANVILNFSPLGTAAIARITLGESLTGWQVGTLALVILGAGLAQWRRPVDREVQAR